MVSKQNIYTVTQEITFITLHIVFRTEMHYVLGEHCGSY